MNILIIFDMEGCVGVSPFMPERERLILMQKEVCIVLNYLIENYNQNSYAVLDFHNFGLNLLKIEDNYPNVKFIHHIWNYNFTAEYDFAMIFGMHVASQIKGNFAHTFRGEIKQIYFDKQPIGETEILIDWLHKQNIPTLLINGDKDYCSSIELFPEIKRSSAFA